MLRKRKSMMLALLLLLSFFPLLSGCYTPAGRTAGDVIDDSTISTLVKAKLFDARELSGFAISVNTFEGVVTLTGGVDSQGQKQRAEEIARSVREVKGVNNLLMLKE